MNLNKWFDQGLTTDEYWNQLEYHKENSIHIYENFTPPEEDEQFFQSIAKKNWRVIVLAEVWCGHCMLNLPVLRRLTEKAKMPARYLPRDENLELMDQYLTNEKRVIPIFIFIDENGHEVTTWGPITKATRQFVNEHSQSLPPKDAENYQVEFKRFIQFVGKSFGENEDFWNDSYENMKETLAQKL